MRKPRKQWEKRRKKKNLHCQNFNTLSTLFQLSTLLLGRITRSQSQTPTVINSWVTSCVYFIGSNGKEFIVHLSAPKKGAPCCSHSTSFCHDSSKYFKVFFFFFFKYCIIITFYKDSWLLSPKFILSFCLDLIQNHQWCGSESVQLLGNFLKSMFLLAFLLFLLSSCLKCRNDAFVSSMRD